MDLKRRSADIDPGTLTAMRAALRDTRDLTTRHDSRTLALAMLDTATVIYGKLKLLGQETDASLDDLFGHALRRAKTATGNPQVVMATQNEDGTATILQSSGRPS